MSWRGADYSLVLLTTFRLFVPKFVCVFCVVSNIWFCVDRNDGAINKTMYIGITCYKLRVLNGLRDVFSIHIQYLHLINISAEEYHNRDNRGFPKHLRLVRKEEKGVSRVDQWYIFLCHGDFKGMELYDFKQWIKVVTEVP